MANVIAGFGFKDSSLLGSSASNYAVLDRQILYSYGTSIAYGDPVKLASDGTIQLVANGDTTIDGIFLGCNYVDANSIYNYSFRPSWTHPTLPSGTLVTAKVAVDPTMLFIAQLSGGTAVQTNIGNNVDILANTSGVPNAAGYSTCLLDGSAMDTTATKPFRIVGIVPAPGFQFGYDPTAANNLVYVKLNTSDLLTATGI